MNITNITSFANAHEVNRAINTDTLEQKPFVYDFWQFRREIVSILNQTVWRTSQFENEKIISLERVGNNYIVKTNTYCMEFNIDHLPFDPDESWQQEFTVSLDKDSIEEQSHRRSGGLEPDQLKKAFLEISQGMGPCEGYTKMAVAQEGKLKLS